MDNNSLRKDITISRSRLNLFLSPGNIECRLSLSQLITCYFTVLLSVTANGTPFDLPLKNN